jgi:CO/xanthine dehydrogenase FAD-binding subunit
MKPAPFEYRRPSTVEEASAMLAADEGARVIAGGQTLVPMMAMRLARPTCLVDIARIPDLAFVRNDKDAIVIGAATRQCMVEQDPLVASRIPLLARIMPWIGHAATRARGTVGGSLANADPSAEIALVAVTLDAVLTWRDAKGTTDVGTSAFFVGPMMTSLPNDACLVQVSFPVWSGRTGNGFHEISARRSDFAFASAAAQLTLDGDGRCGRLAVAVGAVTDFPLRLGRVEQALEGTQLDPASVRDAVQDCLADIETNSDLHASAAYRRRAAAALATRAILDAHADAQRQAHAH